MNNKQLLTIMDRIDERLDQLTMHDIIKYRESEGILTILEEVIDEVLWSDDKIQEFWHNIHHTTYDGTQCEAADSYEILERFFFARFTIIYKQFAIEETKDDILRIVKELHQSGKDIVGEDNIWSDYADDIEHELKNI